MAFFPMIESVESDAASGVYPFPEGPCEAVELLAVPYVLVMLETSSLAARVTPRIFKIPPNYG